MCTTAWMQEIERSRMPEPRMHGQFFKTKYLHPLLALARTHERIAAFKLAL
ncbi:hypothetical protein [Thalassotalea insulae]|uniref:hypothetical protein n=1 Tax=Thalassotalea insulae TaxID=2056778 RepID=UPI0024E0CC44|nr:hypothetical protein [Thalassotalea insulae]